MDYRISEFKIKFSHFCSVLHGEAIKDSLLRFGVILQNSHQTSVIYFNTEGTNIYYILIKRQIIRLSNDGGNIKMGKTILLKIN